LTDARFAQVERCADFLHRHVFVIVENDDEAFVAIQASRHQSHQIAILQAMRRVLSLLVLKDVDLANILVAVGLVPFLVKLTKLTAVASPAIFSNSSIVTPNREAISSGLGGLPSEASIDLRTSSSLECCCAPIAAPSPSFAARQHRAANARHAIGLELDAAFEVERVDRIHQAEHACADEIVKIDTVRQPRPDAFGVILTSARYISRADFAARWSVLFCSPARFVGRPRPHASPWIPP